MKISKVAIYREKPVMDCIGNEGIHLAVYIYPKGTLHEGEVAAIGAAILDACYQLVSSRLPEFTTA
jgi:hypothetical protein